MAERHEPSSAQVRIDPATGRLWMLDAPVTMEPRYERVLALLASAKGAVVAHASIDAALWQSPNHYPDDVSESRRKAILYLNGTLGARYIENSRGEGYRLLEAPAQRAAVRPPGDRRRSRRPDAESPSITFSPPPDYHPGNPEAPDWSDFDLPLDELPPRGALPPRSRPPTAANAWFTGRGDDLLRLAKSVNEHGATGIVASTGIPGIGKTQLANEFVHRYGRFFPGGVFWLNFATPDQAAIEMAALGDREHLGYWQVRDNRPAEDLARLVQQRLSADPTPRLLVFDNCELPALLRDYRPQGGGSRVLLTARLPDWPATLKVHTHRLDLLPMADCIDLLRRLLGNPAPAGDEVLQQIAEELGQLPLALHIAGSTLANARGSITPTRYLQALRDANPLPRLELTTNLTDSPTKHIESVGRTYALALDAMADDPPAARDLALQLLARAGAFAPGVPVPCALLAETTGREADDLDAQAAITRLVSLGLLEWVVAVEQPPSDESVDDENPDADTGDGARDAVTMHRLVSLWTQNGGRAQDGAPPRFAPGEAELAVESVVGSYLRKHNTQHDIQPLRLLVAHGNDICERALKRYDGEGAFFASLHADSLRLHGDIPRAHTILEQVLQIDTDLFGTSSNHVAFIHNQLGQLLGDYAWLIDDLGFAHHARIHLIRALRFNRKTHGRRHSITANTLTNLGRVYMVLGKHRPASMVLGQAAAINEARLQAETRAGKITPATAGHLARSLARRAQAHLNLGDSDQASEDIERALVLTSTSSAGDDATYAIRLMTRGRIRVIMNKSDDAIIYFPAAQGNLLLVLGTEHPLMLTCLRGLAEVHDLLGNDRDAEEHRVQADQLQARLSMQQGRESRIDV